MLQVLNQPEEHPLWTDHLVNERLRRKTLTVMNGAVSSQLPAFHRPGKEQRSSELSQTKTRLNDHQTDFNQQNTV